MRKYISRNSYTNEHVTLMKSGFIKISYSHEAGIRNIAATI